jgi:hypothetical protein
LLAFAGDLGRKGLVWLSVEHVGYHAYNFVGFMLFLSLVDIKTDTSSLTSSTSTILPYLDTNAHVVETVWVGQLNPLAGVETDC